MENLIFLALGVPAAGTAFVLYHLTKHTDSLREIGKQV